MNMHTALLPNVAGNAAEVIRELEQFRDLGVTHFMFRMPDLATVERFVAAVVPHFDSIG